MYGLCAYIHNYESVNFHNEQNQTEAKQTDRNNAKEMLCQPDIATSDDSHIVLNDSLTYSDEWFTHSAAMNSSKQ